MKGKWRPDVLHLESVTAHASGGATTGASETGLQGREAALTWMIPRPGDARWSKPRSQKHQPSTGRRVA